MRVNTTLVSTGKTGMEIQTSSMTHSWTCRKGRQAEYSFPAWGGRLEGQEGGVRKDTRESFLELKKEIVLQWKKLIGEGST